MPYIADTLRRVADAIDKYKAQYGDDVWDDVVGSHFKISHGIWHMYAMP